MVYKRTSADSVIFSYLPKNVVWSSSPPVDKTRVVVCQDKAFQPQDKEQIIDEATALFYTGVDIPVNVYARRKSAATRVVYCGWLERTNTSSWRLLHSDPIPLL